jgi:hypothetical protein
MKKIEVRKRVPLTPQQFRALFERFSDPRQK